jgi:hypothetical protein
MAILDGLNWGRPPFWDCVAENRSAPESCQVTLQASDAGEMKKKKTPKKIGITAKVIKDIEESNRIKSISVSRTAARFRLVIFGIFRMDYLHTSRSHSRVFAMFQILIKVHQRGPL